MPDYHLMYLLLASAQADVLDSLKAITEKLIQAQQEAENLLLDGKEADIRILPIPTGAPDK